MLLPLAQRLHQINYSGTHRGHVHVMSGLLFNEIVEQNPGEVICTSKPHVFFIWGIPFFIVDSEERFVVSRRVGLPPPT